MEIFYNYINIGVWNIHGLYTSVNTTKLCKIDDHEVKKHIKSFDILCIQETLCGPRDVLSLSVEGFKSFPYHTNISENQRYFGGILLLIRDNIRSGVKILENHRKDKIWLRLKKEFFGFERDMFICFAYIPPASSEYAQSLGYDFF